MRAKAWLAPLVVSSAVLAAGGCTPRPLVPPGETPAGSSGSEANPRGAGATTAPATADPSQPLSTQAGMATWYSDSLAGRHTASGAPYDPARRTAAHRRLPFGTRVRVVRTDNGRSVEVTVNDRGPFGSERRIIDLSRAAATELRMLDSGVVPVRIEVLELGDGRRVRRRH